MTFREWLLLFAATGHLALALLSTSRTGKSPLALPLAILAFDFFGWTFADFCNLRFDGPLWRPLDIIFTSFAPAVVLHVVLTFVGKRRAWNKALIGTYTLFGLLALSSVPGFFTEWGSAWVDSRFLAFIFLAGWLPSFLFEIAILMSHLRSGIDADEQARTRLVLAALLVGSLFASTDLLSDLGLSVPRLTPLGTLISSSLLAVVALRFRLFDRNLRKTTALYGVAVSLGSIVAYLALFQGLGSNAPALAFGVTVVTLLLVAVTREVTAALSVHRERIDRLAVLGRFSAQMAHDLKNPLSALVGAVQVLAHDDSYESQQNRDFYKMIVEQADRIRVIVERYDRVGRVEPVLSLVRINEIATKVTSLSQYSTAERITVLLDLDDRAGECELDPDLIAGALENIVRNAIEAMPTGGQITVRTCRELKSDGDHQLEISISDTGDGMDARQAERAFDDFYTSKSTGSGLGLAFVRRVALAHRGDVSLTTSRGIGTTIFMRLPIA